MVAAPFPFPSHVQPLAGRSFESRVAVPRIRILESRRRRGNLGFAPSPKGRREGLHAHVFSVNRVLGIYPILGRSGCLPTAILQGGAPFPEVNFQIARDPPGAHKW